MSDEDDVNSYTYVIYQVRNTNKLDMRFKQSAKDIILVLCKRILCVIQIPISSLQMPTY